MAEGSGVDEAESATGVEDEVQRPGDTVGGAVDAGLRPTSLAEYVGQKQVCENLDIALRAALAREETLDHILFVGPPGLGKTSLAHILAREMGSHIHQTSGPVIERAGDLAAILTSLERGDVLFIDEIHRLSKPIEEILYPAMEDYRIDIVIGEGPSARSISLDLERFTLVGATTRSGLLSAPLRSRFGNNFHLEFYDHAELEKIVHRSAGLLQTSVDGAAAVEIARRSRGTPRTANHLLRRLRDYADVRAEGRVTLAVARRALETLGVDELGLDGMDRRLLTAILEKFDGGPVGLYTIAAAVGEDASTLEEVYEPYLIRMGLLQKTGRGRVATPAAWAHFDMKPTAGQTSLFERK